ncbi:4'-phosphopantetheinyl transferase superfamily protein [Bacillus subtilis]|uniref:4'-phosphopantetheinyl transferase family protein n=1 Tax=Bacillus subtilis TaxID=1423 RepID=UPI001D08FCF3|nr:4'-phosphopantetheinyl transferase superfamily protein [Bacillus subtilis]MCB7162456.1 4'-phosphopantetheinyl transferase superfamily protein [Bacillus subtilis]MCB7461327.1 4'-phosphopantetheinyl transferase superfamily protein [Bacillus subtilis]
MRDVEIYWIYLPKHIGVDDVSKGIAYLDKEELQTFYNYRVDFKKIEFLTGRILLKSMLGKKLQVSPNSIHLHKDKYGKLHLKPIDYLLFEASWYFNLSHSNRIIACVLSTHNHVGIDVEHISPDYLHLKHTVFTNTEIEYILQHSVSQSEAFFELWTRKEAYIKSIGTGFSISPNLFSVPVGTKISAKGKWEYFSCKLFDSYILSVVTHKETDNINRYLLHSVNFYDIYNSLD